MHWTRSSKVIERQSVTLIGMRRIADEWINRVAARRGDFYRLTPDTRALHAWEGWQMHDPETGSGVVALWRSEAPASQIRVRLRDLDPSRTYTVTDLYDAAGRPQALSGDVLARGLDVSVPPMGAALRTYRLSGA
jgi:hypothetical protein